jgi:hypothetical protein
MKSEFKIASSLASIAASDNGEKRSLGKSAIIETSAHRLALVRRHAPEHLHPLGDGPLLAERRDAHLFERGFA